MAQELGCTPTRYMQLLARMLERVEVEEAAPKLVRELRVRRDAAGGCCPGVDRGTAPVAGAAGAVSARTRLFIRLKWGTARG